jgi:hypothetical protein
LAVSPDATLTFQVSGTSGAKHVRELPPLSGLHARVLQHAPGAARDSASILDVAAELGGAEEMKPNTERVRRTSA